MGPEAHFWAGISGSERDIRHPTCQIASDPKKKTSSNTYPLAKNKTRAAFSITSRIHPHKLRGTDSGLPKKRHSDAFLLPKKRHSGLFWILEVNGFVFKWPKTTQISFVFENAISQETLRPNGVLLYWKMDSYWRMAQQKIEKKRNKRTKETLRPKR